MVKLNRFDVCIINLDPTIGSEIKKTRPCLIISPDSMNHSRLNTVIVAPMTTTIRENFPTRINIEFNGRKGQVALDQLRAVDKERLINVAGSITKRTVKNEILHILKAMFS